MRIPHTSTEFQHDTSGLLARILGDVHHRIGDGVLEAIPRNQDVTVDIAIASMVVSWVSDGQPVTAALARAEFIEYVNTGAIQMYA